MVGGRPVDDAPPRDSLEKADLRDAYEHGRRDERARRKRHPIGMTVTFAAAVFGVAVVVLALMNGSFGAGGQVMDQSLAIARDNAAPVASQAASDAGQSARDAAQSVRDKASNIAG
jgi:hypothetical protein